jgi:hypothetical protein
MDEFALLGLALRFVLATLGVVGIALTLRWLNKLSGNRFDAAFRLISADAHAAAHYFGLRAVGVFLFYGLVMG